MIAINLQQELRFIYSEKNKISNAESLQFQLLNIADVLFTNYVNEDAVKMKRFYKTIYIKTKNFYLKQYTNRID